MTPIQMLWIGPRFSNLERLSVASFLANGHPVHLFAYGPIAGVPAGTTLRDAREIYPESAIYTYPEGWGKGSPAGFANQFRYRVLFDHGGAWSDTDMVCLRPLAFLDQLPVAVASQRMPPTPQQADPVRLNPCFMKAERGDAAIGECLERCLAMKPSDLQWGMTGPDLATEVFLNRGLMTSVLMPDVFCRVDFWRVAELCTRPLPEHPMMHGVHLWNEMWRFSKIDKDATFAPESAYEALKRRFPA
jgi:hypothetical protein